MLRDQAGNIMRTAKEISFGSRIKTFQEFVGRADKVDFYKFKVPRSQNSIFVGLSLSRLKGNADIELLNSKGNRVAISRSRRSTSEGLGADVVQGNYYIRVFHTSGKDTSYKLEASMIEITENIIDEPDDPEDDPGIFSSRSLSSFSQRQTSNFESGNQGSVTPKIERYRKKQYILGEYESFLFR